MTTEEKIGQLFVNMGSERSEEYLKDVLEKYHIGAVRYNPGTSKEVHEQNRILRGKCKDTAFDRSKYRSGWKRSLYRWN